MDSLTFEVSATLSDIAILYRVEGLVLGIYAWPVYLCESCTVCYICEHVICRAALQISFSNASFSVGEHPTLPGYFLRNHLTKQEV